MAFDLKKARKWIDKNPKATNVNINAYVAALDEIESLLGGYKTSSGAWACRAFMQGFAGGECKRDRDHEGEHSGWDDGEDVRPRAPK